MSFYIRGIPKISFGYLRSCPTSYISCNHPGERWRTREVAAVQGAPPPLCPTTTIISSRCTKTNTPQNNFQFSIVIFKTKRKAQSTELLLTKQFATYDLELLLKLHCLFCKESNGDLWSFLKKEGGGDDDGCKSDEDDEEQQLRNRLAQLPFSGSPGKKSKNSHPQSY